MKKRNTNKGFTLIETLIAITALALATGAAFALAHRSLKTSNYTQNQTTAYFLAAEGIELVRTIRENLSEFNTLNNKQPPVTLTGSTGVLSGMCAAMSCNIDSLADLSVVANGNSAKLSDANAISTCSSVTNDSCRLYVKDSAPYDYRTKKIGVGNNIGYTETPFKRQITISALNTGDVKVVSKVSFGTYSYTITTVMTNWQDQ